MRASLPIAPSRGTQTASRSSGARRGSPGVAGADSPVMGVQGPPSWTRRVEILRSRSEFPCWTPTSLRSIVQANRTLRYPQKKIPLALSKPPKGLQKKFSEFFSGPSLRYGMNPLAIHALTELRDLLTAALVPQVEAATRSLGELAEELGIPDDESIVDYVRRVTVERDTALTTKCGAHPGGRTTCGQCFTNLEIELLTTRSALAESQAENKLLRDAYAIAIDKTDDALAVAHAAGRREGILAAYKVADGEYEDARDSGAGGPNPDWFSGQTVADRIRSAIRSLLSETAPETPTKAGWVQQIQDDAAEVATWPEYKQGRYAQVSQDAAPAQASPEADTSALKISDVAHSEVGGDSLVARLRADCSPLSAEAADALERAESEVARRIAEAVATERETCALEAEFIANSLGLGAAASAMSDDTESLIRRDAGARVAGRVANVIRTRAKKGE